MSKGYEVNNVYDVEGRNTMSPGDMKIVIKLGGIHYEIGHLFAYNLKTTKEVIPRQAMGSKTSSGATSGRRSHNGVLIFNVMNESIVHELKEIMYKTNNPLYKNGGFISEIKDVSTFGLGAFDESDFGKDVIGTQKDDDAISAMELPPFDLVITSQNPNNHRMYSQKKIVGITITGQQGAIGLDTITAQEQYPFVCKHVTPLTTFEIKEDMDLNSAANISLLEEYGDKFYQKLKIK